MTLINVNSKSSNGVHASSRQPLKDAFNAVTHEKYPYTETQHRLLRKMFPHYLKVRVEKSYTNDHELVPPKYSQLFSMQLPDRLQHHIVQLQKWLDTI